MRPGSAPLARPLFKRAFLPFAAFLAVSLALFCAGNFLLFAGSTQHLLLRSVRFCGCALVLYALPCGVLGVFRAYGRRLSFLPDVSPLFAAFAAAAGGLAAAFSSLALAVSYGNAA